MMKRIAVIAMTVTFAVSSAFGQSDEEIIETLRTSAAITPLGQALITDPELSSNKGLSPSDKERLMRQLVKDSADCLADAVVEYAALFEIPISDFVSSEGVIKFEGDSFNDFEQLMAPCILAARQAAGLGN